MSDWKKVAIVTGATSGFGKIYARMIDENFQKSIDEIWIVGRREKELEALADSLSKDVRLFPMDLTDKESVTMIEESIRADKIMVKYLVNAAGFGVMNRFEENTKEEAHNMVALNCMALTDLTRACIPYMPYNSRIVNFASVAAFLPQPNFAVYAATKSYVLSFSRALNCELNKDGVYVTAVCPGPSATEFFDKAIKDDKYPKYKRFFWAEPEEVVKKAFWDALRKSPVSVYSLPMKALRVLAKSVPHGMMLSMAKYLNS